MTIRILRAFFAAVKSFNTNIVTSGNLAIMKNPIIVSCLKEYSVLDSVIKDGRK